MNQKEIKAIKKEISESTAFNVGYYVGLPAAIVRLNEECLFDVMQSDAGEWLLNAAKENHQGDFMDVFVTEAIKGMTYQDFKKVASYFFCYRRTESEILAEEIPITRAWFNQLRAASDQLFALEHPPSSIEKTVQELTTKLVSNGAEVVAVNPIDMTFAVIEDNLAFDIEPRETEGLINDYRRAERTETLLTSRLLADSTKSVETVFFKSYQKANEFSDSEPLDALDRQDFASYVSEQFGEVNQAELIQRVNAELASEDKEIISRHVTGFSQGEAWTMFYLWDKAQDENFENRTQIENYLEHEVGAYYKGNLTQLTLYDENKESLGSQWIDREDFLMEEVEKVKAMTGNRAYVSLDKAQALEALNPPLSRHALADFVAAPDATQSALLENYQAERKESSKSI